MLYPRLTNCPECANISELLKRIDCKLAELGNSLYNNISYMLNQPISTSDILQLIIYKRILMFKYVNPDYVYHYSISKIASKVILLTLGCESKLAYIPTIRETTTTTTTLCPTTTTTTSSTTSTTTTSSSTTTSSTTTIVPTTTTTTTITPTTTTTTTVVSCPRIKLNSITATGYVIGNTVNVNYDINSVAQPTLSYTFISNSETYIFDINTCVDFGSVVVTGVYASFSSSYDNSFNCCL